jgi:hypothetical protein
MFGSLLTIFCWKAPVERNMASQKEETEKPISLFSPGLRRANRNTHLLLGTFSLARLVRSSVLVLARKTGISESTSIRP